MARYRRRSRLSGKFIGSAAAAGVVMAALTGHHAAAGGARAITARAVMAGGSEDSFIRAVLADLGAPATRANVTSLASWFPHEFPSFPPAASWNPMASTLQMSGSTVYNSAGVQNYTDPSEGAQATAATLANGWYPQITGALRSGTGLCGVAPAEFLTWSGNGYSGVC